MKNLTAHYNIYFNANELLNESKSTIRNSKEDDFSQLLSIFPTPDESASANEKENLNTVISKVNKIALDKYESNWLDDAYLLLAEAQYLKRDYYNAIEYYSYVEISFPDEKKNKLAAYLGQVKADFALDLNVEADSVLNLAKDLNYKYQKDEVAASEAELALRKNNLPAAIKNLENAIDLTKDRYLKIRWRYTLAQLQEQVGDSENAIDNYDKIAKSNAAFEISFNANLAKIRITERNEGKEFDKIATLKRLLKEDKNREFKEQIYYQIGNAYADNQDLENASKFYETSAHAVPSTVKQRGLSYLKLAQLNFEQLKDYKKAQLYYDSTITFLPKTYPNYEAIAVKANNLQYLADRLNIIDEQKDLLQLSNLSDEDLQKELNVRFVAKTAIDPSQTSIVNNGALTSIQDFTASNKNAGTFYFDNNAALSQGLSSFKQKWGNRKLADNWRVSSSSLPIQLSKNVNYPGDIGTGVDADINTVEENVDSLKARFVRTIPYNPSQKIQANNKIATSLYEIAVFYKDVLKDNLEAIDAYDAIVNNYPNQENASSIYFQLYRLTEEPDSKASLGYKNELLTKYPGSIYAKTILDPNYGKGEEQLKQKVADYYNSVFTLYKQKNYQEVLQKIQELKSKIGDFKGMDAKYDYLNTLAFGHTQKAPAFLSKMKEISANYPEDLEVTPRVNKQIAFVEANQTAFNSRPTALLNQDDDDFMLAAPVFVAIPKAEIKIQEPVKIVEQPKEPEPQKVVEVPKKPEPVKVVEVPKKVVEPIIEEPIKAAPPIEKVAKVITPKIEEPIKEVVIEKPVEKPPVKPVVTETPKTIPPVVVVPDKPVVLTFGIDEFETHNLVIDVLDARQNIAVPFSFISQYLYSKYNSTDVKLVIRVIGTTDKFIIIDMGLTNKAEAILALEDLKAALPYLLKDQKIEYKEFIVSEDNLKLLKSREAINQYLKFISK